MDWHIDCQPYSVSLTCNFQFQSCRILSIVPLNCFQEWQQSSPCCCKSTASLLLFIVLHPAFKSVKDPSHFTYQDTILLAVVGWFEFSSFKKRKYLVLKFICLYTKICRTIFRQSVPNAAQIIQYQIQSRNVPVEALNIIWK